MFEFLDAAYASLSACSGAPLPSTCSNGVAVLQRRPGRQKLMSRVYPPARKAEKLM